MEDSFKVRVDGSLQAPAASSIQTNSSSLSSLWSLTDEEIERNKWLQDKIDPHTDNDELNHRLKNPKPYSPFLQHLLAEPSTSDIQELDDGDDEDENKQQQLSKPEDHNDEEEEDAAYDKVVAAGNEESADRFYMKDVNDYEVDIDSTNELPTSFTQVIRDPRANHTAAKLRLKEDEKSARKIGLQVSDSSIQESNQIATGSGSSVPDYVRNPSKYTHYTFDSLDDVVDEESNRKAYMELFNSLKSSSAAAAAMEIEDDPLESIIFTRRKKSSDVSEKKSKVEGYEDKKVVPISIADSDEVCMMDEDEPEMASSKSSKSNSLPKIGRRYRTKGGASASVGME